jgi:hypothetical protein
MADIALVTANRVEIVGIPEKQISVVAGEDVTAGAPCTFNSTGKAVNSDANGTPPLNTVKGIADKTVKSGQGFVLIQKGRLDGYDLSGLAYGDSVFVSDTVGRVGSGSGTASLPIGFVEPVTGNPITSSHDKILNVNIQGA